MRNFVSKLGPFNYTIHNLVAHPLMEILYLIGLGKWGDKLHDATLPIQHKEDNSEILDGGNPRI